MEALKNLDIRGIAAEAAARIAGTAGGRGGVTGGTIRRHLLSSVWADCLSALEEDAVPATVAEPALAELMRRGLPRERIQVREQSFRLRLENSEYRIHRTGGAGTVACPWPSDRWSVVRLGGERFADFLLLFDASIPEIVSQVPAILGAIRERELEERRREMARGIGKAAVRSLLEQHLLPLGLSARFSLGEDGLVTLEMSRQESARLVVPLEDLAGTLGDLESVLLMLTAGPARIVDGDAEK